MTNTREIYTQRNGRGKYLLLLTLTESPRQGRSRAIRFHYVLLITFPSFVLKDKFGLIVGQRIHP